MSIVSSEIKQYLSGGSGNAAPNSSLGGVISTTEITDDSLNNLFDDVTGEQHEAGYTDYRCFYIKNTNGSLTAQSLKIWIETNTPAADDTVQIGIDPAGINGTATTIGSETSAPSGVSFSSPSSGSPIAVGNVPSGEYFAVWVKRIVSAGSTAQADNYYEIKISADTL